MAGIASAKAVANAIVPDRSTIRGLGQGALDQSRRRSFCSRDKNQACMHMVVTQVGPCRKMDVSAHLLLRVFIGFACDIARACAG